jgi:HK97 family phage major capsid protein
LHVRAFTLPDGALDTKNRTVNMSFSSTTPILRSREGKDGKPEPYYEVLSHDSESIVDARLRARAVPFLLDHDKARIAGKVVDYEVADGKGLATAKISRNAAGQEFMQDAQDGIRTEISVGYYPRELKLTGMRGGVKEFTVQRWEPYEISSVGVPADYSVGLGRGNEEMRREAVFIEEDEMEEVTLDEEYRAEQEQDHKSQYGNVPYADSKHHKYPIDTKAHVKAAWSYINMPKNAKFYSSSELATIKGKIKAAAKKFGIEISEEKAVDDDEGEDTDAAMPSKGGEKKPSKGSPMQGAMDDEDDGGDDAMPKMAGGAKKPILSSGSGAPPGRSVVSTEDENTMAEIEVLREDVASRTRDGELSRTREIMAVASRFNLQKEAEEAIRSGQSLAEFQAWVLSKQGTKAVESKIRTIDPFYGTNEKERSAYNLVKALNEGQRELSGFEKEMSAEVERQVGRRPDGFFVPEFALFTRGQWETEMKRDLVAGTPDLGGDLIMTYVEPSLIPFLRNRLVVGRMGASMFTGLRDNFALPRQTGAGTASWQSETGALANSNVTFDQVLLSPLRLGSQTAYSRWLLNQARVDVQTVVRQDLLAIIALEQDRAALFGTGTTQPTGVFNVAADTVYPSAYSKTSPSVTFAASGAPTWAEIVSFEGHIEQNNIDLDDSSCGYVVTPNAKSTLKTTAKVDPRAVNQFYPEFIWEGGPAGGPEGRMNGYRALASNQLNTTNQMIFAKWSDMIIGLWGGLDLLTDPYSLASNYQIKVIVNIMCNITLRYGPSFCYSTNPAGTATAATTESPSPKEPPPNQRGGH